MSQPYVLEEIFIINAWSIGFIYLQLGIVKFQRIGDLLDTYNWFM